MNEQPKKTYTMEDNLKFISFGLKDLIKAIQDLTQAINKSKPEDPQF